jgi:hypothetical protein
VRLQRAEVAKFAAVLAAALALVAGSLLPATARADGDPASDVLLGDNVFYPYQPPVSSQLQKQLNDQTAAAKRSGFPIKVALIAAPVDLGVIPDLFGKPQKYAAFLDQEISFRGPQPLLVVMKAGYGVEGLGATATSLVKTLARPASGVSNDLARAALTAVSKLAQASGHPISKAAGTPSSSHSSGGSSTVLVIALAAAALAAAGALAAVTLRRRQAGAR